MWELVVQAVWEKSELMRVLNWWGIQKWEKLRPQQVLLVARREIFVIEPQILMALMVR
jgi:hypothetical protein